MRNPGTAGNITEKEGVEMIRENEAMKSTERHSIRPARQTAGRALPPRQSYRRYELLLKSAKRRASLAVRAH